MSTPVMHCLWQKTTSPGVLLADSLASITLSAASAASSMRPSLQARAAISLPSAVTLCVSLVPVRGLLRGSTDRACARLFDWTHSLAASIYEFRAVLRRPLEVVVELYSDAAPSQITAVAFVSPDWHCIEDGLPPSSRYVHLQPLQSDIIDIIATSLPSVMRTRGWIRK